MLEKVPKIKDFYIVFRCSNTQVSIWIGVGVLSLISFAVMGTSGFFTPYQIDDPYSIYVMTYGEYYLLILVGGYIVTMFCAALTMLVTVKIGSFVFRQISLLMFLYILLFIVLLPLIYIGYSRYGLKKK